MLQLFLFAAILAYTNSLRCPWMFCNKFNCPDVSACDGVIRKGLCGCCNICVTESGQALNGPCAKETNDLKARLQHTNNGMPPIGLSLPVCTSDGYYAPKQCRGSRELPFSLKLHYVDSVRDPLATFRCFCVDKNGGRAERYMTNIWEAGEMNCQCARAEYEYQDSRLIGKIFNCASNGNYEPIQCTGSMCYCVDLTGSQVGTNTVKIEMIDKLNC